MKRTLRKFHRILGAFLAIFLILFAVTGILLNHSADFKLNQQYVNWPWLMQVYGIGEIRADNSYLIDNKVISQLGDQLFVDDRPTTYTDSALLGGIALDDVIVLANRQGLILLSRDGAFLEKLGAESNIPTDIQNIGEFHGEPVLQTRQGMFRSDYMLDKWDAVSLQGVAWSENYPIPTYLENDLKRYFFGKGVSAEQIIIDIHNGHILGTAGKWLWDLIAILLVVLSLSGLWLWLRRQF
jgi:hypothetical protein